MGGPLFSSGRSRGPPLSVIRGPPKRLLPNWRRLVGVPGRTLLPWTAFYFINSPVCIIKLRGPRSSHFLRQHCPARSLRLFSEAPERPSEVELALLFEGKGKWKEIRREQARGEGEEKEEEEEEESYHLLSIVSVPCSELSIYICLSVNPKRYPGHSH